MAFHRMNVSFSSHFPGYGHTVFCCRRKCCSKQSFIRNLNTSFFFFFLDKAGIESPTGYNPRADKAEAKQVVINMLPHLLWACLPHTRHHGGSYKLGTWMRLSLTSSSSPKQHLINVETSVTHDLCLKLRVEIILMVLEPTSTPALASNKSPRLWSSLV